MNVLFLAFANSSTNPLPNLSREDDGIFSILVNRQLKGHFLIHRESFATTENINKYLYKYKDNLTLFLFSGHANDQALLLRDQDANAKGVAYQLGEAARRGNLKLVILNGCSTAGQVNDLLEAGVPAVVATSAPVGDSSATAFSIRFFQGLIDRRLNLERAFEEALGPAQTATDRDLQISSVPRSIGFKQTAKKNEPIWGLYVSTPAILSSNPIPYLSTSGKGHEDYLPNEQLTQALFEALLNNKCRDIRNLQEKAEEGEYVEVGDKQTVIVNVLPYPMSVHLQKLLCPVEQENEGFDKISVSRLEQCGLVFHTTTEFMAFILLAQLWELKLKNKITNIPSNLVAGIKSYFYLTQEQRLSYNYLNLIRAILTFFDTIPKESITYFVEELEQLRTRIQEEHTFAKACDFLNHLRQLTVAKKVEKSNVLEMCIEAEDHLSSFFAELGFVHRYTLVSIQNIDVQKYRHQLSPTFSHEAVKLMRAFGKPEQYYYTLTTFMDNRGIALLKGKMRLINAQKREFDGEELSFLNLSPFVIDRNAFEEKADLTNPMFFELAQQGLNLYSFKNVKRPNSAADKLQVDKEGPYSVVFVQLEAFRSMILNEGINAFQ